MTRTDFISTVHKWFADHASDKGIRTARLKPTGATFTVPHGPRCTFSFAYTDAFLSLDFTGPTRPLKFKIKSTDLIDKVMTFLIEHDECEISTEKWCREHLVHIQ